METQVPNQQIQDQTQLENDPSAQVDAANQADSSTQGDLESPEKFKARVKAANEEAKAHRQKAASLARELEALRREKAEKEGDWRSVAEEAQRERDQEKDRASKMVRAFGSRLIGKALEAEAQRMGCIDTEAVTALVDTRGVEIDDEFGVDQTSIKEKLEDLRKRKPFLFQGKAPMVRDVKAGNVPTPPVAKRPEEMSDKEFQEYFRNNFHKAR